MVYKQTDYLVTDYDEAFRGQFHYSVPSGWMNDINGLWYYNGIYHLSYQSNPHDLIANVPDMHWAHATSIDLLHWEQQPIMLEGNVNATAAPWSGSTVVDIQNVSGLKTGDIPAFITFYTGTSKGTCMAYSCDGGNSWTDDPGNPLFPGSEYPRDPHVFSYGDHWVLALFQDGTTFYTSTDLLHWEKASQIDFGFECPDIYELAIDGDADRSMWVLQDASGKYLLGQFDGYRFTATDGPHRMDIGPDFYAAQTFFRDNLPDDRVIQIVWLGNWGSRSGLNTKPWRHGCTFPATLQLKTFPEGVRVARYPIDEIAGLYENTTHIEAITLAQGENLFPDVAHRCYDLEVEFDLKDSNATEIRFQLGNKLIVYDVANSTIFDNRVELHDSKLHFRILVDWGQVELFVNHGQLSYSQNHAFDPKQSGISVTSDGDVFVNMARLSSIQRIWPTLKAEAVNDTPLQSARSGQWRATSQGLLGCAVDAPAYQMVERYDSNFSVSMGIQIMIGPQAGLAFMKNEDGDPSFTVLLDTHYAQEDTGVRVMNAAGECLAYAAHPLRGGELHTLYVERKENRLHVALDEPDRIVLQMPAPSAQEGWVFNTVYTGQILDGEARFPYPGYALFFR